MSILTVCPYCLESVNEKALKCVNCGEFFDEKDIPATSEVYQLRALARGIAIVLSAIIPGLGQLFQRRILWGLAVIALFFVLMAKLCWGMTIYHTMLSIIGFGSQGDFGAPLVQRLSIGVFFYLLNILDVAYCKPGWWAKMKIE